MIPEKAIGPDEVRLRISGVLRSEPSPESDPVKALLPGSTIKILDWIEGNWWAVEVGVDRGYFVPILAPLASLLDLRVFVRQRFVEERRRACSLATLMQQKGVDRSVRSPGDAEVRPRRRCQSEPARNDGQRTVRFPQEE